jgi:hypothetical protein
MSKKKRDSLLIGTLLIVFGLLFIVTSTLQKKGEFAYIKVKNQTLFSINLTDGTLKTDPLEVVIISTEAPRIEDNLIWINDYEFYELEMGSGLVHYQTGDETYYYIQGNLGYVVILYDQSKKQIKIDQETSPYNICSKQGWSDTKPIICLPNFVTIEFNDTEADVSI